jgi:hypothetical protein
MREVDSTATGLEMDSAVRALVDPIEIHDDARRLGSDDMAEQKADAKRWAALVWGVLSLVAARSPPC